MDIRPLTTAEEQLIEKIDKEKLDHFQSGKVGHHIVIDLPPEVDEQSANRIQFAYIQRMWWTEDFHKFGDHFRFVLVE